MQRAQRRKYHYIYKTTCLITSKYYIGMHSTDNLNDGYFGSGHHLTSSIKKYGKKNHQVEILEFLPDRKSLANREKEIVNEEMVNDSQSMNLCEGGEIGWTTKQNSIGGKKGTTKQKWLLENDAEWATNFKTSISNGLKRAYANGDRKIFVPDFTGQKHSAESKKKIGEKNSIHQQGEKNSQFGTCWIHHLEDKLNKKIKKEELDLYLEDGWCAGRKMKM